MKFPVVPVSNYSRNILLIIFASFLLNAIVPVTSYSCDITYNVTADGDSAFQQVKGFPVVFSGAGFWEIRPVDLDKDNHKEIFVFMNQPMCVQAYSYDGQPKTGWTVSKEFNKEMETPVFHDFNNDKVQEVLLTGSLKNRTRYFDFYTFDNQGSQTDGWNLDPSDTLSLDKITSNPALLDVDLASPGPEIVVGGGPSRSIAIRAYSASKDHKMIFSYVIPHQSQYYWPEISSVGGGDMDKDGVAEIAGLYTEASGASNMRYVFLYDPNAPADKRFWIKPLVESVFPSDPLIGDIDQDGKSEIVVGLSERNAVKDPVGKISVFSFEGNLLDTIPLNSTEFTLALADLDGDKNLEIICAGLDGVSVFRSDGKNYKNWPKAVSGAGLPLVVGDIDSDNIPEIIVGKDNKIYAWKEDGTLLPGFPFIDRSADAWFGRFESIALSDIDGDGNVDLLASNFNSLFAINLKAKYDENNMLWPMRRHDLYSTSMYGNKSLAGTDDPGNISIPKDFILDQNYPNPFNPSTTIHFNLPENGYAKLSVYNTLGQLKTYLIDGFLSKGGHTVLWNADKMPSGIYIARLEYNGAIKNIKMLYIK